MEKRYSITVTGSGTADEIIESMKTILYRMTGYDVPTIEDEYEDEILTAEIKEI